MTNPSKIRERYAEQLVANFDSKFFKVLSEPVRVQILKFLILNGSSDVGSIAQALPQDRSVISRHLKFMHEAEILSCEKVSRNVYYDVNAGAIREKLENIAASIAKCMAECGSCAH
ncbi:MAG: winged helix-turn-helix transcriptional regulator [Betaproteobacteria bacterium]|nr:winged helix-turn-helix transcriptional regulator [Betaproteobacteria bacterium]